MGSDIGSSRPSQRTDDGPAGRRGAAFTPEAREAATRGAVAVVVEAVAAVAEAAASAVLWCPWRQMTAEAATGDAVKLVVAAGNGRGAESTNQAIPGVVMPQHGLLDACKARHARLPVVVVSEDTDPGLPRGSSFLRRLLLAGLTTLTS